MADDDFLTSVRRLDPNAADPEDAMGRKIAETLRKKAGAEYCLVAWGLPAKDDTTTFFCSTSRMSSNDWLALMHLAVRMINESSDGPMVVLKNIKISPPGDATH